jgi:putative two-component system response regulator
MSQRKKSNVRQCYEDLRQSHALIKEAYMEMLLRLAIAAEYKDTDIGTHIIKVSDYATAIAHSLGLPDTELELIRYGSMVHDIGKIGIPQQILDKRTALTKKEFAVVQQHPLIGGRIFSGSKSALVRVAGEIALTHHERYDGTGYPRGLKGDHIPLYGRIVALADCFDAMTSERSYKAAQRFERAIEDVGKKAGMLFDPQVALAFVKVKDVIRGIFEANITIDTFLKELSLRSRRG